MFGNYDWYTMPGWGDDPATANIKELYDIDIISIDGGGNAAQRLSTMIVGLQLYAEHAYTPGEVSEERLAERVRFCTGVPKEEQSNSACNLQQIHRS